MEKFSLRYFKAKCIYRNLRVTGVSLFAANKFINTHWEFPFQFSLLLVDYLA